MFALDTVKGHSRSDCLLSSPYHWAKLSKGSQRGCAYEICNVFLSRFRGLLWAKSSNPCISVGFWMTISNILFAEVV